MNVRLERRLAGWLAERDPGAPSARLRASVAEVPYSVKPNTWPIFDRAMVRIVGAWTPAGAAVILLILLATLIAVVGAVITHPWDPFPPRGLIAYTAGLEQTGSTGIRLIAADGSGTRQITAATTNIYEHSPRWSRDGKTLLFARTTGLDPFGSCPGVGSVVLYDLATATERVVATGLRPIDTVEWSPNGDKVAYLWPPPACGAPAELGVVDVATGQVTTTALGDGRWEVRWTGSTASAVKVRQVEFVPPGTPVTPWEVPSPTSAFVASYTLPGRDVQSHLSISSKSATTLDLGIAGGPVWSPDGISLAFVQFIAFPSEYATYFRDRLSVVDAATGRVRSLADVFDADVTTPDGIAPLPRIWWTQRGTAIYWLDGRGGHIVEIASGRTVDLPAVLIGCDDLQWQPLPG